MSAIKTESQTPRKKCAYFKDDEKFKQTGCIMNAGLLALIKFPGLGFEEAIKQKYQSWKKWKNNEETEELLKQWLNVDHPSVNKKWLQKFRKRDQNAIDAHGNLLNLLHNMIVANREGLPTCNEAENENINKVLKDLDINKDDGDVKAFMQNIMKRYDINLTKGKTESKDNTTYTFITLDDAEQINIERAIKEHEDEDKDSSLYIINTPKGIVKKVVAPQEFEPFKGDNYNKKMRLVSIIAKPDDVTKVFSPFSKDKISSVYVLNPCQGTKDKEVWYKWDVDNTAEKIPAGIIVDTNDIRKKLATKGYIWMYAPVERIKSFEDDPKVADIPTQSQPQQPAVQQPQQPDVQQPAAQQPQQPAAQQPQQPAAQQPQQSDAQQPQQSDVQQQPQQSQQSDVQQQPQQSDVQQQPQQPDVQPPQQPAVQPPQQPAVQQQQSDVQPPQQSAVQQQPVYIGPVSREDIMKDILKSPPMSQGLQRQALVETIECEQACDVLKYAKHSNVSPVVVLKSEPTEKTIGYRSGSGGTARIYSISSKANSPIGTLALIIFGTQTFGTFLKIRKQQDQWIKLNNPVDVDMSSESSIFVKGVGQFNIKGFVIPKM